MAKKLIFVAVVAIILYFAVSYYFSSKEESEKAEEEALLNSYATTIDGTLKSSIGTSLTTIQKSNISADASKAYSDLKGITIKLNYLAYQKICAYSYLEWKYFIDAYKALYSKGFYSHINSTGNKKQWGKDTRTASQKIKLDQMCSTWGY